MQNESELDQPFDTRYDEFTALMLTLRRRRGFLGDKVNQIHVRQIYSNKERLSVQELCWRYMLTPRVVTDIINSNHYAGFTGDLEPGRIYYDDWEKWPIFLPMLIKDENEPNKKSFLNVPLINALPWIIGGFLVGSTLFYLIF